MYELMTPCRRVYIHMQTNKNKLRGFSPQTNYTDRASDRRLSAKLVPTLEIIGIKC
jgi:hypothetical protein